MSGFQSNVQPMQPPGPPPGMMLNPAFAQWQQQNQQVQAVVAENNRRTQQFEAAVAIIKRDGMQGFRLDIEADSTIAPDEQAEKMARVEFLRQMVPLLQQIGPIAQGNPAMASLAKEIALFAARGFRVARPLEEAFEQAFDALAQMPPVPPKGQTGGPQQNPQLEQAKVAADVHDTQLKAQTDMAAIGQKAQQAAMDAQGRLAQVDAENERSRADQAIKVAELTQRDRLENARIARAGMQSAQGLG